LLRFAVSNFEIRKYRSTAVEKMSVIPRQLAAGIASFQAFSLFMNAIV